MAAIELLGAQPVILPHSYQRPRPFDATRYRARNAIKCCFGRLKQWRRLSTRYDRKARHFMAFLYYLAAFLIWNP
ncbi:hypothetical protein QU481_11325 [Crenobacter sp. SG2303]|uniref:Transposase DDE domain-containing protein n=1 Tax=Crenobacter oryzisoli TaxID=3056844 RepID=A0ABT7XNV8_9NEIS|nr:hypothetical protein [Crenobacter sp. SG2303]MDN0075483.1 hypothetical protein [Crenobacter sp. SG2303]